MREPRPLCRGWAGKDRKLVNDEGTEARYRGWVFLASHIFFLETQGIASLRPQNSNDDIIAKQQWLNPSSHDRCYFNLKIAKPGV
ncbi:hypothetical protein [Membranihabitans marinus]|uniref:hypothetical protein n=1 Tax=Membranihabitans marinus TaxID=1227546 RepID=UPI001F219E89|nr:hypothetical protein [Membranihabitans marinus]